MSLDLLPPNATATETAISRTTARIDGFPTPARSMWNPDTCPVAFLPWLAWTLSVDEWDGGWSEETKREVIRASIGIHRQKGTLWAVKRALQVMGYGTAIITEGRQTMVGWPWVVGDTTRVGGANHWAEYWVTITQAITPIMVDAIVRRLRAVAPARCRLTRINVDSVLVAVGGPWLVGDVAVTVGATYPTEVIYG